jgi:hypothetical protein
VEARYKKKSYRNADCPPPFLSNNFIYFLVIEGAYLHQRSQSPYEGDVFHETPTGLVFYTYLLKLNFNVLQAVFILCDVLTAFVLTEATRIFFQDIVSIPFCFPFYSYD